MSQQGAGRGGWLPFEGTRPGTALLVLCVAFGLTCDLAGRPAVRAAQQGAAVAELVGKARTLELRGRTELARETWEQVLQQDPANAEALKGIIRVLQAPGSGHATEAAAYVARLRAAHPDDPGLPAPGLPAPGLPALGLPAPGRREDGRAADSRAGDSREAERLAHNGKYSEAMAAYRRLYGANPPPGEVALSYYAAEGATDGGRPEAIASLRALADRYPRDARYRHALGSLLVLNARTQQEGEKLLGGKARGGQVLSLAKTPESPAPAVASVRAETVVAETAPAPKPATAAVQAAPAPLRLAASAAPVEAAKRTPEVAGAMESPRSTSPLISTENATTVAVAGAGPERGPLGRPEAAAGSTARPGAVPASASTVVAAGAPLAGSSPAVVAPTVVASVTPKVVVSAPREEVKADRTVAAAAGVGQAGSTAGMAAAGVAVSSRVGSAPVEGNEAEVNAGYTALKGARLRDAELRFKVALAREPEDARALEGLGLVRLRQSSWSEAARLLEQAQKGGAADTALLRGLKQARSAAGLPTGNLGQSAVVKEQARAEPESPRALAPSASAGGANARSMEGVARTAEVRAPERLSLRPGNDAAVRSRAADRLREIAAERAAEDARRPGTEGRVQAPQQAFGEASGETDGQPMRRPLTPLRAGLGTHSQRRIRPPAGPSSRPVPLRPIGSRWQRLRLWLFPPGTAGVMAPVRAAAPPVAEAAGSDLQRAAGLAREGKSAEAEALYRQVATAEPKKAAAPLALGDLLLGEGRSAEAYPWFRAALANDFDNVDSWAGLLASLGASGHDREMLTQTDSVPASVRAQLAANPLFLQAAVMAYARESRRAEAMAAWEHLQQVAAEKKMTVPAGVALPFAEWLGAGESRNRGPALPRVDGAGKPNRPERYRAAGGAAGLGGMGRSAGCGAVPRGDAEKAKLTLSAAAGAFADNPDAMRLVACGYMTVNQPKLALAVLKAQDLSKANVDELALAVSSALAERDNKTAEGWLRTALLRFGRDPELLMLASRYEHETGHERESAAYLQAALAAGPGRALDPAKGTARVEVASAEIAGAGSSAAPNLADVLAPGRAGRVPAGGKGRPYLPSLAEVRVVR